MKGGVRELFKTRPLTNDLAGAEQHHLDMFGCFPANYHANRLIQVSQTHLVLQLKKLHLLLLLHFIGLLFNRKTLSPKGYFLLFILHLLYNWNRNGYEFPTLASLLIIHTMADTG